MINTALSSQEEFVYLKMVVGCDGCRLGWLWVVMVVMVVMVVGCDGCGLYGIEMFCYGN